MKKVLLCICVLIGLIFTGCPKKENKENIMANDTKYDFRVFDAELVEVKSPQEFFKDAGLDDFEEKWKDFMYL